MLEPQPEKTKTSSFPFGSEESPRKIYDFLGKLTFISCWLGLQDG